MFLLVLSSCKQRNREEYNTMQKDGASRSTTVKANGVSHTQNSTYEENNKKNIKGKAVRIIDGDTFVLLLDNNFETGIRLNGVDCPEKRQAFSQRARKELSDLIFGREVMVYYDKKDGFGRVLGEVHVGQVNINHEMLRRGMAWHYVKYSDDETLAKLEEEARVNRVGLWSDPNAIPPWDYRRK